MGPFPGTGGVVVGGMVVVGGAVGAAVVGGVVVVGALAVVVSLTATVETGFLLEFSVTLAPQAVSTNEVATNRIDAVMMRTEVVSIEFTCTLVSPLDRA